MPCSPRTARVAAAAVLAVALVPLALAAPASAHVTVAADDAHQGVADSVLTFRVPNEESSATTVKVVISFPARAPLASVRPAPKPGWTVTTTRAKFATPISTDDGTITEGVSKVVFTARTPQDGIPVDGFDNFQVLVGPLPSTVGALAFPTVQTYSDGKEVSWIEPVIDAAAAPEFPAPTLALNRADPSASGTGAEAVVPAVAPARIVPVSDAEPAAGAVVDDVRTARNLGMAGVAVGAVGLLAGVAGLRRGRSSGRRAAGEG